jgi:uncharacterized protein YllA (UPF0747 family)
MGKDSTFAIVDPADIPGSSSPWSELLAGEEHSLLPPVNERWDWERHLRKASERHCSLRVKEDLLSLNAAAGISGELLHKLDDIWSGRGGIVVTGQQPGLFGGPLYALYKALTAIACADSLEKRFDLPVAPLFWIAGDDDDFQEVRTGWLSHPDWRIVKVEAPAAIVETGRCVGDIPSESLAPALETARRILGEWDNTGQDAARALGETDTIGSWGDHFTSLLARITGGRILLYDARSSVWREEASGLFRSYIERHAELLDALEIRNGLLRSEGVEPPIKPQSLSIPLTVVEGGMKRKLPGFDADAIRQLIDDYPGSICPNVTLRSPAQDALFPVCASVIGPGELLYLSQISPVYELLAIPEPARVPRLTMTFVPSSMIGIMRETGILPWELLGGYESIRKKYIGAKMPPDYYHGIDRLSEAFEREARKVASAVGKNKKLEREIVRIRERIESLKGIGEDAARQELRKGGEDLQILATFCRPPGALQERVLSSLFLLYSNGPRLVDTICGTARSHLARLEGGRSGHMLMEIPDR